MENNKFKIDNVCSEMNNLTLEGKNKLNKFINFSGKKVLCVDNDSTVMDGEIVDVLAQIVGGSSADEIYEITNDCMDGKIKMSFEESLRKRINILVNNGLNKNHIKECVDILNFSYGFEDLVKNVIKNHETVKGKIFILSGGFEEIIKGKIFELDLVNYEKEILANQVFANSFIFDDEKIIGVDFENEEKNMWRDFAKGLRIKKLRELGLISNSARVLAVGDGSNDVDMISDESEGLFVAYSGVVARENTISKSCGLECKNFFEVGNILFGE